MLNNTFLVILILFCLVPILGELLALRNFRRVLLVMIDDSDRLKVGEDLMRILASTKQKYNLPPMFTCWSQQILNHLVYLPEVVFSWFETGNYLRQLTDEQLKFYGECSRKKLMIYYHRSFWATMELILGMFAVVVIVIAAWLTKLWLVTPWANLFILVSVLLILLLLLLVVRALGFPFKLAYAALPSNWDYVKSAYGTSKNSVLAKQIDLDLSSKTVDSELINKLLDGSDIISRMNLADHVTNTTLASKIVEFQRLISVFKVVLNTPLHLSAKQRRDIIEMYLLNNSMLESLSFLFSILDDSETLSLLTHSISDMAEQTDRKMFVSFNQLVDNLMETFDQVNSQLKESLDKTLTILESTTTDKLTIEGNVEAMNQQQKLDYFNKLFEQRHEKGVDNNDTKENQ